MDWNKLIDALWDAARRVFTFLAVIVFILGSVTALYIIARALWWLTKHAEKFFGT